ncbi:MAG TPA: hypothetical protein VJ825_04995 [Gemmatimonadaceae bacterium]|nr:hypothetical protein [Gemmatimonadaceae bacterium]
MIRPISLGARLGLGLPGQAVLLGFAEFAGALDEVLLATTALADALLAVVGGEALFVAPPEAEPGAVVCVVGIGPATAPVVSDVEAVCAPAGATVVVSVVLLLVPEVERALPLQAIGPAATTSTNETRTERYIFPSCC